MNTTNATPLWAHRLATIAAWFALCIMAAGIGALTYQTRVLHLEGEFWQWFALVVAFAPATSTAVVAAFKFFAVSDSEHDKFLWVAFGIDLLAVLAQLLSVALYGTQDTILGAVRVAAFVLSASSFVAVMLAAGMSSYRLKMVAEREREKQIERAFDDTLLSVLKSDETYRQMQALSAHVLRERFETLTGKRLSALGLLPEREDNGHAPDALAHAGTHTPMLDPLLRVNGNGTGRKRKGMLDDPNA